MFLWVTLAIILLLLTLLLHYNQHFTIKCSPNQATYPVPPHIHRQAKSTSNTRNSFASISSPTPHSPSIRIKKPFLCRITQINEETLQFYPSSFALYIIFIIILTLTVIVLELLNRLYHSQSVSDEWLYGFELYFDHQHSILNMHQFKLSELSKNAVTVFVLDSILIFGVMILAIWESLFTFYRYYTTKKSTKDLQLISTKQVLKQFMIYPIIFCILFILQIYIYYWLWPFIILLHFVFNGYFTYKFAALIINTYKMFDEIGHCIGHAADNANKQILESVYVMRRASFISATIQCIYLSLFVITYNMNTVYYLPLLWAISCTVFAFNFAKNRTAIHHIIIRLSKVCDYNDVQPHLEENTDNKTSVVTVDIHPAPHNDAVNEVHKHVQIHANPLYGTDHLKPNDNEYHNDKDRTNSWRTRHFSDVVEVKTKVYEHYAINNGGKAMKLLGLDKASNNSNKSQSLTVKVSNSIRGALSAIKTNSGGKTSNSKSTSKLSFQNRSNTASNKQEKMQKLISDCEVALFGEHKSNKSADHMQKDTEEDELKNAKDELVVTDAYIGDDHNHDEVDYGSDKELPELVEMDEQYESTPSKNSQTDHIEITTDIVPSIDDESTKTSNHNEANYAEALRKLNALAAIGFCSTRDLNSFDQIKQYNQHLFKSKTARQPRMDINKFLKQRSASDRDLNINTSTEVHKNLSVGFVPKLMSKVKFKSKKNSTSDFKRTSSDNPQPTTKNTPKDTTADIRKARSAGSTPKKRKQRFG